MAENKGGKTIAWILGGLVVVYLLNQAGIITLPGATPAPQPAPPSPGATPGTIPCPYAPTVSLGANDKHASGQTNWGSWKYKLNGGTTSTDADGGFEVAKGSDLDILVADANSSAFYRALWSPEIAVCGLNSLSYDNVIAYTRYATKCYNEDGDPINGSTYTNENLTIGLEGTRDVKCEVEGVSNTGMPYGGMMILEFNQSTYKIEDLNSLTLGGAWASQKVSPEDSTTAAYSVGIAGATTKSFKIPPIDDTGTYTFTINTLQAKSDINPGEGSSHSDTAYGDGIYGRIFPINCYEEEDITPSEFRCGLADMDSTFTSPGGTAKGNAAVTHFEIPVT